MIVDFGDPPRMALRSIYGCLAAKASTATFHITVYIVITKAGNIVYRIPCVQIAFCKFGFLASNRGGLPRWTNPEFRLDMTSRLEIAAIRETTTPNRNDIQGHLVFQDLHSFHPENSCRARAGKTRTGGSPACGGGRVGEVRETPELLQEKSSVGVASRLSVDTENTVPVTRGAVLLEDDLGSFAARVAGFSVCGFEFERLVRRNPVLEKAGSVLSHPGNGVGFALLWERHGAARGELSPVSS
jgi:hypothetical protein